MKAGMGIPTKTEVKDWAVHLYLVHQISLERVAGILKTSKPNVLNICRERGVKLRSKSQAARVRTYI